MTTFDAPDTAVVIQQCWGCNRLRAPKPWASKPMIDLLRSEGRLRIEEYLCGNANCSANVMAGIGRKREVTDMAVVRIPLTIVATASGQKTDGVLVGVMASDLDALEAKVERLERELDEAQLRSIEARNPGVDMDDVRRRRAEVPSRKVDDEHS